ncbi:MAG: hypothetical protein ABTR07_14525 [Candidatus Competibacter denitrificans]|nr:hypothetical protein [Candidatus Competibacter denitrificans]HRC68494.1 hypothetical protein [Candidatus Competibacter denitrificans]
MAKLLLPNGLNLHLNLSDASKSGFHGSTLLTDTERPQAANHYPVTPRR